MASDAQTRHVAVQVRRHRTDHGWTLDAAATRLGVSRRLLAQIEAGDANPSLNSLLAIATGFGIPLVDLLADSEPPPISVQTDNGAAEVLWSGPAGSEARLLVASGGLELWQWTLQPRDARVSAAHRPGTREALLVDEGVVTVTVDGAEPVDVGRGQSAAFPADLRHTYANASARLARFVLAVHETG